MQRRRRNESVRLVLPKILLFFVCNHQNHQLFTFNDTTFTMDAEQKYNALLFYTADAGTSSCAVAECANCYTTDQDGKVSGAEGVTFLRRSGLSDQALMQVNVYLLNT